MITAVDSNVLLDVFGADDEFGERSREALRDAIAHGSIVACDIVWAEVSAWFPSARDAEAAMDRLGLVFSPIDPPIAGDAGIAWRTYRRAGGGRTRIVADFLIGAHAAARADRLLTRDRGFYRTYFKKLQVTDPTQR